MHDLLLAKKGIALPASHGLRVTVEKHKARLQSEFTRARLRRKCPTLEALKAQVDAQLGPVHPRWVRVNAIKSTIDEQLETTFKGFEIVPTVEEVIASASTGKKVICLDGNVPNLAAASPGVDFTKTPAYKAGKIILQDKASCFPAYLLDPRPEDGDIIDACSAPGNKTTQLAAILHERGGKQRIFAFEKDPHRAKTLQKMVATAGSDPVTTIHAGQDFLKADPNSETYARVGALLLDPSCSGSGIVGRDDTPEFQLPSSSCSPTNGKPTSNPRKRKQPHPPSSSSTSSSTPATNNNALTTIIDDAGIPTVLNSQSALFDRLASLASFQLSIILHAFAFPAARKVTYSTCSIHAIENEGVVAAAIESEIARKRGWRVLKRGEQVRGMRGWGVRGDGKWEGGEGASGKRKKEGGKKRLSDDEVEGCVRAERGDGRGVMGFFVVCFVRDGSDEGREEEDEDGPYVRDAEGMIVRDENGIPTLKSTGRKAIEVEEEDGTDRVEVSFQGEDGDEDGPFERDGEGMIVRGPDGMPRLKRRKGEQEEVRVDDEEEDDDEWGGFDD